MRGFGFGEALASQKHQEQAFNRDQVSETDNLSGAMRLGVVAVWTSTAKAPEVPTPEMSWPYLSSFIRHNGLYKRNVAALFEAGHAIVEF
jgi:hypothetical protein